jgi:hypothetical protein
VTILDGAATEEPVVDRGWPLPGPGGAVPSKWEVQRLQRDLEKYRAVLAGAWSDETRHPSFTETSTPGQSLSVGQCGASSAWLMRRLRESWPAEAQYCFGSILLPQAEVKFHCWVELGEESSATRLVIDLTCDQFKEFRGLREHTVLCESYGALAVQSIQYQAQSRRNLHELRTDPVWPRLEALERATSLQSDLGLPRRRSRHRARCPVSASV